MRVSVPIDRALERGLRPVSSTEEAEGALETLASHFDTPIPWNRDGRLVKDRYAEGNLEAMVEVISTLLDVESVRRLNDGQRNLLDRARKAFSREIGAALGVDAEDAEVRIDAAAALRREAAPPPGSAYGVAGAGAGAAAPARVQQRRARPRWPGRCRARRRACPGRPCRRGRGRSRAP